MTTVKIFKKNGTIISYSAEGHSGYSEYGSDIVCSSISTALQMPLLGMQEVLNVNPIFEINEDGFLEVDMRNLEKDTLESMSIFLRSMEIFIDELSKQYPKNIKLVVKEEK